MDLTETIDRNNLLTFALPDEADRVNAVTAACREAIIDIVRLGAYDGPDGPVYRQTSDDHVLEPLGVIASGVGQESGIVVDELALCTLKLALKIFSDPEQTKRKVDSSAEEKGYLNNPYIERRLFLGHVARRVLEEIDPDFAAEPLEASTERYRQIAKNLEAIDEFEEEPEAQAA